MLTARHRSIAAVALLLTAVTVTASAPVLRAQGAQGRRARERRREPGKIRVGPVAMRRLAWPAARLLHGAPARFG